MIAEGSFFFAIASVSVTLAGFSGLVAAFRRGDQLQPVEVFHLRTIAEVGLSNALIALSTVPVAILSGDIHTAARVGSALVIAAILIQDPIFAWRQRSMGVRPGRVHAVGFVILDVAIFALGIVTLAVESVGGYEMLMILLLARPIWDFVWVLRSLAEPRS